MSPHDPGACRGSRLHIRGRGLTAVALRLIALSMLFAEVLAARFVEPDLELVPLSRLIANLESRVAAKADAEALHQLARAHAMAYSWRLTGTTDVTVSADRRNDIEMQPDFFLSSRIVPYRSDSWASLWTRAQGRQAGDPPERERLDEGAAKKHLDKAIDLYRRALPNSDDWRRDTVELGLAWCLAERGDDEEAAELLRGIVQRTAPQALERKSGPPLGFLPVEAMQDLLTLLNEGRLAPAHPNEITDLESLVETLKALPRAITPLAIDLAGQARAPESMIDKDVTVTFDLDGSGRQLQWTWIRPPAAWLVWDPNESGVIRDALQLFGNRTFNLLLDDGFAALRLLDDDHDGWIHTGELKGLALWHDSNTNGVCERGEVKPLQDHGIVALSTSPTSDPSSGLLVARSGVVKEDGSTLDIWDLVLDTASQNEERFTE